MKKRTKFLDTLIILIGLSMIISGILFALTSNSHCGYNGGLSYASTSIEFGADFYTTAAQYTGLAANTLVDLYDLVKMAIALFFIFAGLLVDCLQLKAIRIAKSVKKTNKIKEVENVDLSTTSDAPNHIE